MSCYGNIVNIDILESIIDNDIMMLDQLDESVNNISDLIRKFTDTIKKIILWIKQKIRELVAKKFDNKIEEMKKKYTGTKMRYKENFEPFEIFDNKAFNNISHSFNDFANSSLNSEELIDAVNTNKDKTISINNSNDQTKWITIYNNLNPSIITGNINKLNEMIKILNDSANDLNKESKENYTEISKNLNALLNAVNITSKYLVSSSIQIYSSYKKLLTKNLEVVE